MAKSETNSSPSEVGPSIILGLVGAVVVLVVLGAGIWGVGKIISKVREGDEDKTEETAEETTEGTTEEATEEANAEEDQGDLNGEGVSTEDEATDTGEVAGTSEEEKEVTTTTNGTVYSVKDWVANDYRSGDITGENYTVVWGDTLWEIAEAKYGSGFEWGKIRDANLDIIGFLPDGSRALIFPGQVLALP